MSDVRGSFCFYSNLRAAVYKRIVRGDGGALHREILSRQGERKLTGKRRERMTS